MDEAKAAGVADIIDLDLPSENDLEKELLYLEKEQEKLIAELRKAYQDQMDAENDVRRADFDKEMERRAKAMNILNQAGAAEQLSELQTVCFVSNTCEVSLMNIFKYRPFCGKIICLQTDVRLEEFCLGLYVEKLTDFGIVNTAQSICKKE